MSNAEYKETVRAALTDYGDAVAEWTRSPSVTNLSESLARFSLCLDLIDEREDFHTREADLLNSKAYDAGMDIAVPFYGRNAA